MARRRRQRNIVLFCGAVHYRELRVFQFLLRESARGGERPFDALPSAYKAHHFTDDTHLLIGTQIGEHGQRNDLRRHRFRDREVSRFVSQRLIRILEMKRHRIVDSRADVHLPQMFHQTGAVLHTDHVQVINAGRPFRFERRKIGGIGIDEKVLITCGGGAAVLIPVRQTTEFDLQESGLNGVQPAIEAFDLVVILSGFDRDRAACGSFWRVRRRWW